ncbi:hypothetical protein FRC03_009232 [Tulasnella sp. 419]|nr:hypothetical protein FRC03_009232 [Tulasnella sp. 419]
MASPAEGVIAEEATIKENTDLDPIWNSSSTARQIHALGNVEEEIATLLQLAASAMRLLAVPNPGAQEENIQATESTSQDPANDPYLGVTLTAKEEASTGEERSELFVEKANQYFDTLDSIQHNLRRALYDIRQKKISPSSITAPPANFIPRGLGVGPSSSSVSSSSENAGSNAEHIASSSEKQGLQEMRAEKAAWLGMAKALTALQKHEPPISQGVTQDNDVAHESSSDTDMDI